MAVSSTCSNRLPRRKVVTLGVIRVSDWARICRELVGLMEGNVASRPNAGSSFRVVIPVEPAYPPGKDRSGSRRAQEAGILLVEDSPTNQFVVTEMLKSDAMAVDVVDNGADAVTQCAKEQYDLVLMDIQMPGMNDFARGLRRHRGQPQSRSAPHPWLVRQRVPRRSPGMPGRRAWSAS